MAGPETFEDPLLILIDEMGRLGLENTSGVRRYYSAYLGVAVAPDPGQQGMVKVIVRATGQSKALPLLARPSSAFAGPDYGFYTPPEVGDVGWVLFDHGDPTARPRWLGSFWRNPRKDGNSDNSQVPSEFKTSDGLPQIRGFKTPRGSGWRISDQSIDPFLELWTGLQAAAGEDAIQAHLFRMQETPGLDRITIRSKLGHLGEFIDLPGSEQKIIFESVLGHKLEMNDLGQFIQLTTPQGREINIDDINQIIRIETLTQFIRLNEAQQAISSFSPGTTDETAGTSITKTAGTNIDMIAGAQINATAGAAANITAGALATITALGVTVNSLAGLRTDTGLAGLVHDFQGLTSLTYRGIYNLTTIGLATLNFLGAMTLLVTGVANIGGALCTALGLTIGAAVAGGVILGAPSGPQPPQRLANELLLVKVNELIAAYNLHTHTSNGPGAPTGIPNPPNVGIAPADPATMVTFTTVAN